METSQQVSSGSFSCGWLMKVKLPDAGEISSSFMEMHPEFMSKGRKAHDSIDFEFSLPSSSQPSLLVHADQIFSDGLLLPLHLITPPKGESMFNCTTGDSVITRSLSVDSSKALLPRSNRFHSRFFYTVPSKPLCSPSLQGLPSLRSSSCKGPVAGRQKLPFSGGCANSYKKLFHKYLFFLIPIYKKVRGLVLVMKGTSLRKSDASVSIEQCHAKKSVVDASTEMAIHDAVVYCKNSLGKLQ